MDWDEEYYRATVIFDELKSNNLKLEFLQQCISDPNINLSELDFVNQYNQLEEEECDQMIKLNFDSQRLTFLNIIIDLAKKNHLDCQTGEIEIKTQTLGRWKKKKYIISVPKRTFELLRKKEEDQKKLQQRILQLQYYELKLKGQKDKKWRFIFKQIQKEQGYYKELECRMYEQKQYDKLIEILQKLCFTDVPTLRSSMYLSQNMQSSNLRMVQSGIRDRRSINPEGSVQTQKSPQSLKEGEQNQSVENKSQKQQATQADYEYAAPTKLNTPSEISSSLQQFQKTEQIIQNQKNQIQNVQQLNSQNSNSYSYTQQNQKSLQQDQQSKSPLLNNTYTPKDSNQRIIIQVKEQKILEKQESEDEDQFEDALEFDESEVQPRQLQQDIQFPSLYQSLSSKKLDSDLFDQIPEYFNEVFCQDKLKIYRNSENPLQFRSIIHIPNQKPERIFQTLAEIEFMKKWNGTISSKDSKFIQIINGQRLAVIYERRKQYGYFYLPRDYVYLRYVYEQDGAYCFVDKSIEHDECPSYLRVVRGDINYQIVRVKEQNNQTIVQIEIEVTNGGFSNAEQDGQITQVYLQELTNLDPFLQKYSQETILISPLLQALQLAIMQRKQKAHFTKINSKEEFKELSPTIVSQNQFQAPLQIQDNQIEIEIDQQQQIQSQIQSQSEQMEQIIQLQRKLSTIPDIGTFKPYENQPQDTNEIAQLKQLEKVNDFDEIPDEEYVPTDILMSNSEPISEKYRQKIEKQIKIVENGSYIKHCLTHKYILEPTEPTNELVKQSETNHFFFKDDWSHDKKNGGLLFVNPKKVEAQKKVIKFMLKKIGSNLLTGKSILSISLPVGIFETRSNLERFAYSFIYAPRYLEKGALMSCSEEQMKMTISFGLSSIVMYLSLEKPFNPILGETYQGFINNNPVFVEQVSHHPPICAFQLYGKGYTMDGHIESVANMNANSVQGKNVGYLRVNYHNTGVHHHYIMVPGIFNGTAFGDRYFNLVGKGYCLDLQNNIVWDATFNPGKSGMFAKKENPMDYFSGGIYKVKPHAIEKYKKESYSGYSGVDLNKDVITKISSTSGIWSQFLEIDGQKTWDILTIPYALKNHPNPLPSDSNYRLDILYWKLNDFDNSQRTKELLENFQRNDRKLKEKFHGKKH